MVYSQETLIKDRIVQWLRDQVRKAKASGLMVGMSGGVDSSLVAVLAKEAMGQNLLGLILPCHSQAEDVEDAKMVAQAFSVSTHYLDLSPVYDLLVSIFPGEETVPRANIKPRLRMITLYYFANLHNYLVAGTGNKSELLVGYFTKYGDGGVDLLPLGGLTKTQVRRLAAELGIPEKILAKPPTAGLWPGQTDEGELGITYEELDAILATLGEGAERNFSRDKLEQVKNLMVASAHKRQPPAIFQP